MRRRKTGHHVAAWQRPSAVVVHSVDEPKRSEVEQRSGGRHVEIRGGGLIERSYECVADGQLAGVGDAARLQPQIVAHSRPKHAPLAVAAAHKSQCVVHLDDEPASLHRAARRAGVAGQGGNDYAVREGEQKSWGRRRVDHGASPVEVKGIMISQNFAPKSTQRI